MLQKNVFTQWLSRLCHASVFLYILWLMLPCVQTTLGAMGGIVFVGLFGLSVLLNVSFMKQHGKWFVCAVILTALMPLFWAHFMGRGGTNLLGYYVQQGMFWFPLLVVAYARKSEDRLLTRYIGYALLITLVITTLTTIGWLIQGMTRGDRVYAYSRSLGSGEANREEYLKELMLRNIGGYGFVYATVLCLPFTCFLAQKNQGIKRGCLALFVILQAVMVVLSQYTYAMLYTAVILLVEGAGFLFLWIGKGKISQGKGMLLGLVPLFLLLLLHQPLLMMAVSICESIGFTNFAFSLQQLLIALQGGVTDSASRFEAYVTPLQAFASSPLFGSMFGQSTLGYHSEVLDLLAGVGILGSVLFGGMVKIIGHNSLVGCKTHESRPHLFLMFGALFVTATLGTVLYSNEISMVLMGALGWGITKTA